jgi:hypothetical protein
MATHLLYSIVFILPLLLIFIEKLSFFEEIIKILILILFKSYVKVRLLSTFLTIR